MQAYTAECSTSGKRRKLGHVIELEDNDDLEVVSQRAAPSTPADHSTQTPRAPPSTRSRGSAGSMSTFTETRSNPQFNSEFRATQEFLEPRRSGGRRPRAASKISGNGGGQTPGLRNDRSASGSTTMHHRDDTFTINERKSSAPAVSARKGILLDFQQGVVDDRSDDTTSHHFPTARINESTSETKQKRTTVQKTTHLRETYRPADVGDPISDDELGRSSPTMKNSAAKRHRSPSRASQAANSAAKRKPKSKAGNEAASEDWPLIFARAHAFKGHGAVETDHGRPDLRLLRGSKTNEWQVIQWDPDRQKYIDRLHITSKDVSKVETDNISRLRLQGPLGKDSNRPTFDLEFASQEHLSFFRHGPAEELTIRGNTFVKSEEHMATIFAKDLSWNSKVGTTPMVKDSFLVTDSQHQITPSRTPLWDQVRAGTQSTNVTSANSRTNGVTSLSASSQGLARPVRATRSAAPKPDIEDEHPEEEVERYSIVYGLGDPWTKPLIFGERPHRAVVYFNDLECIDEGEYLNDSVINFYMIYLFNKSKLSEKKVFYFSTQFYTTLTANTRLSIDYAAVKNWTSKVDIFEYDYIVVPINVAMHWYLAIICNVGNIPRVPLEEDFGDDTLATHSQDNGDTLINEVEPAVAQAFSMLEHARTEDVSESTKTDLSEQIEGEVNLFDEQEASNLNLIDREDSGTKDDSSEHAAQPRHEPMIEPMESDAKIQHKMASSDPETTRTVFCDAKKLAPKTNGKRKPAAPKKNPDQPVIIVLDSLSVGRSQTVRALKDWVAAEGKTHRAIKAIIKENGFYPKAAHIPTQSNYTDCGVYLLGYAEKFFANPDEFKNKLLTGEMSTAKDWPEYNARDMRTRLRKTLFKLADEQHLTDEQPVRKKKVKKSSSPNKPQLPKPKSETNRSGLKLPTDQPVSVKATRAEERMFPVTTIEEGSSAAERPVPRLGSPFRPSSQHGNVATPGKSPALPHTVPAPSSVQTTPVEDVAVSTNSGVTSERHNPELRHSGVIPPRPSPAVYQPKMTPRGVNPQVRVHVKTAQAVAPARSAHGVVTESTRKRQTPTRMELTHTSTSATQKRIQNATTNASLTGSPSKKRALNSPPATLEHVSPRTSPAVPRLREGSSAAPIEIPDSQELPEAATQSLQRRLSVEPRPHILNSLRPAPSFEEIPAPKVRSSPRKHRNAEEAVVGRLLEAQLDADDHRMQRSQGPPPEVDDAMDVDERSGDVMDLDVGEMVRETPTPRRRSPEAEDMEL